MVSGQIDVGNKYNKKYQLNTAKHKRRTTENVLITRILTGENLAISALTAGGIINVERALVKGNGYNYGMSIFGIILKHLGRSDNLNLHCDDKIFGSVFDTHLALKGLDDLIVMMIINLNRLRNGQYIV